MQLGMCYVKSRETFRSTYTVSFGSWVTDILGLGARSILPIGVQSKAERANNKSASHDDDKRQERTPRKRIKIQREREREKTIERRGGQEVVSQVVVDRRHVPPFGAACHPSLRPRKKKRSKKKKLANIGYLYFPKRSSSSWKPSLSR